MPMKNPVHPGQIVRHACLDPLSVTVKDAAMALGVSRQALSNIINGKAAISAEMATRLEKAFGGTAQGWVQMQANYDLARARQGEDSFKVKRYQREPMYP